nr:MAG: replication associated protein [Cressdnaviricota sp.]
MERDLELLENLSEKKTDLKNKKLTNKKFEFKLQGKNFFLTYPQCDMLREEAYNRLKEVCDIEFICVGQEHHQDGARHLHVFLTSRKKLTIRNQKFFDIGGYHGNYQTCRDSDDVMKYVTKDDLHPFRFGMYVGNKQSNVQKIAIQNKILLSKPLHELVDEGEVSLHNYTKLDNAIKSYNLAKIVVQDYQPRTCYWIWGATGIGKSRYVRTTYPGSHYSKPMNKWWDGYNQEKIILIDDFDLKGECLGHYLKIWADCYSFVGEVKGATIKPVFDTMIITSQYLPKDIWCQGNDSHKWDHELVKAVQRRFKLCTIHDGELEELDWE